MEMSEPMVLTLIKRNESRLRLSGEVYSLTPEAEDVLRNDDASGVNVQ